ncbi:MAG: hypothetical protein Q8R47_02195 [Nanoarchaeota archaeon]|nr:hypothetical protein [Nanoarchaeota archaeon]
MIKSKRGGYKGKYSILVGVILLLSVVGLAFGAEIQKEFKKHIDVFNQVKSYNDNYYFDCPEEKTLAEAGRMLNNIDSTMRGRINPREILDRCNVKNYFVISGKQLPPPIKKCVEELNALFLEQNVPDLAYNDDTLLFECTVQDHFKKDNAGLNTSSIFASRDSEYVNKVKEEYYNCANVPVEDGTDFSCPVYLAQRESSAREVRAYE